MRLHQVIVETVVPSEAVAVAMLERGGVGLKN